MQPVEFHGGKDWIKVQSLPIALWGMGLLPWFFLAVGILFPAAGRPNVIKMNAPERLALMLQCAAVTLVCGILGWLLKIWTVSRYKKYFIRLDDVGIQVREGLGHNRTMIWQDVREIRWRKEYSGDMEWSFLEFDTGREQFLLGDWLDDRDTNALILALRERIPERVKCGLLRLPEGFRDGVKTCMALGARHMNKGDFKKAESAYRIALQDLEKNLGKDHPEALPILKKYAELLRKMNRPDLASQIDVRAAVIRDNRTDG